MILTFLKIKKSITDNGRVRSLVSKIIRGKNLFINKKKIKQSVLLNIGCGILPVEEFINLDFYWHPAIDICWDITKKNYPLKNESIDGIYTEHCLEHIAYEKCLDNFKEFYRLLKKDGTLRIILPDGEIYCNLYVQNKTNKNIILPYGEFEKTPMISINRIFRSHGHQFIYDYDTLEFLLKEAGFKNVKREAFRTGNDDRLLIDSPERVIESVYLEAIK
jgi:predicted SAM-dependent methyltransferase